MPFGQDGSRFWGATFDPVGLYRQRAVFRWMAEIGLTVEAIHAHALALQELFLEGVRRAGVAPLTEARLVTPMDTRERGHFLTFETPHAGDLHKRLLARRIITDVRGDRLRLGFGAYQTAGDIAAAVEAVGAALRA